jgi:GTP-binding protein HflX
VDAADPELERKVEAVEALLGDLELAEIPRLVVLNKVDLLDAETARGLASRFSGVAVSAEKRRGLDELIAAAEGRLQQRIARAGQQPARQGRTPARATRSRHSAR